MTDQTPPPPGSPGEPSPGGTPPPPWYGEPLKPFVEAKGWKTPDDVVTSYQNLEKLVGADKAGRAILKPKDANDAEGLKSYRAAIGVPDAPAGYAMPAALKDDPMWQTAANLAHARGLPAAEFGGFIEDFMAEAAKVNTAAADKAKLDSQVELDTLRAEWGQKFEANAEFARRFLKAAGWDDARLAKYEQTFGTAQMLKDFYTFGVKTAEHSFAGGGEGSGFTGQKAQVQKQIEALRADRIANKISEAQFHAEMGRLGPLLDAAA